MYATAQYFLAHSNNLQNDAYIVLTPPPRRRRSDTPDVVRRVKALLGGHPDLLDGFNCFLPEVRACTSQLEMAALAFPRKSTQPRQTRAAMPTHSVPSVVGFPVPSSRAPLGTSPPGPHASGPVAARRPSWAGFLSRP